jgi:hypothetical protein
MSFYSLFSWFWPWNAKREREEPMSDTELRAAQAELTRTLKRALGQSLPGVTGYGPRWDSTLNTMALGVAVDEETNPARIQERLPRQIRTLPIRVFVQSIAQA